MTGKKALCLAVFLLPAEAQAGAWLQQAGHGQAIAAYSYYHTSSFFDSDSLKHKSPDFNKHGLTPYFEYGASENLTFGGSFEASRINGEYSLSYMDVFTRASLGRYGNTVFSLQPGIHFPISQENELNPEGGSASPELRLMAGHYFKIAGKEAFIDSAAWIRKKFNGLSDQLGGDLTFGIRPMENLLIMPQAFQTISVKNENPGDYNLTRIQLSGVYKLSGSAALQLGVFRNVLGENTGAGNGALLGVWYGF